MSLSDSRKIFTYDEAIRVLPGIQPISPAALSQVSVIGAQLFSVEGGEEKRKFYEKEQADFVNDWIQEVERWGHAGDVLTQERIASPQVRDRMLFQRSWGIQRKAQS